MIEFIIVFISLFISACLFYLGLIKDVEINSKIEVFEIKDDHDNSRIETKI